MSYRFFSAALLPLFVMALVSAPAQAASSPTTEVLDSPCGESMPMSMVREVDFLSFYPSDKQAVDAAAEIDERMFDISVRTSASTPEWVVRAVYRELPSAEVHSRQIDLMKRIAVKNGSKDHSPGCSSHYHRR